MPAVLTSKKSAVARPLDRFALAPDSSTITPRILAATWGDICSGKTHFALTGPAPVVVLSFDQGTEGVVEQFRDAGKEVRLVNYDWAPDDSEDFQQQAIDLRDQFVIDLEVAVKHARTVVLDKESDVWNLFRYAEWGAPKADAPRDFDKVNMRMRRHLQLPKKYPVNFFAIQGCKEEWVSQNKKSGAVKRDGFRETAGLMHVDLFHERENSRFWTTVGKSRGPGSRSVHDQRYENLDVPTLGMMVFPDSDETCWV